ncbi:hypothetical protein CPC08DRAFT_802033 [Agrocybe pediades]|nr:hypothetical protein CPC08DRAFT_802033 [Agrocybe pediades]
MDSNKPFSPDRLASFAGYVLPPTVVDAMLFYLPRFSLCSHRVVESFQRSWELWSPNSSRVAYYPGAREMFARFGRSLHASMRRYDGHEGRFDPTISPQHYDKDRPWLGFIQTSSDVTRPEFSPFLDVWVRDKAKDTGRINSSFILQLAKRVLVLGENVKAQVALSAIRPDLWDKRPLIPTKDDVAALSNLSKFEEAVDVYAELQREVKIMAAWCSMAEAFISYSKERPEIKNVVPANETLMGVWMNGCDEEEGKWLLASRVPCFIIHELSTMEFRDWVTGSRQASDFHTGTSVVRLRVAANPLDQLAKRGGNTLLDLSWELGQASKSEHQYLPSDKERSSLEAQGWRNGSYNDTRRTVSVTSATLTTSTTSSSSIMYPPPVTRTDDIGGWSDWTEEEIDDDEIVLVKRGKRYAIPSHSQLYYDRINLRRLYLDSPLSMPPSYRADPWIFGLPAPSVRYVELEGHKRYGSRLASTWVYFTPRQSEDQVGRCYSLDHPEDQYDGRPLPGFEPSFDDEVEFNGDNDDNDDLDYVSIPDDEFEQGLYSGFTTVSTLPLRPEGKEDVEMTTPRSPSHSQLQPLVSSSEAAGNRFKNYRRRSPSSPNFRRRSRTPSPARFRSPARYAAPYRPEKRVDSQRSSDQWPARHPRSPRRETIQQRPRSRSPPGYRSVRPSNRSPTRSYNSRDHSPHLEEESSQWQFLRQADRQWSPSRPRLSRRGPAPDRRPETPPGRDVVVPCSPAEETQISRKRTRSPSPTLDSPPRLSLAQRLSEPSTSTLVPYDANFASLNSGLHALAGHDTASLTLSFPTPTTLRVPILSTINEEGRSRFLIIWNMPLYQTWARVTTWIKAVLTLVSSARLMRVIRTNVEGEQVFWLAFRKVDHASSFRGQVAGREAEGGVIVACEFVSQDEYCSVTGNQPPSWNPETNTFSGGLTIQSLLTDNEIVRQPTAALADRLGLQITPEALWTHRKSKRGRRKKQDPADGGAL